MSLSRRKFVGRTVALGAGLALGGVPLLARCKALAAAAPPPDAGATAQHPAVLYDLTQCLGCHSCEVACQVHKGLAPGTSLIKLKPADPSAGPEASRILCRYQCMNCLTPACVSVCPVGALVKTREGPVIYKEERCLGCRYCMNACPFGAPTFDWDRNMIEGALIRKCDFCADRQAEGKPPVCVEACPSGAVIFGKRDELLAEAKARIAAHPDRYVPRVYGETEVGGTSFLILSAIPFEKLSLPQAGERPPQLFSEQVMSATVPFALAWATVLTGITTLARFRDRRASEADQGAGQAGKEEGQ